MTLVCAPAGFGKTTLLTGWLETCPCQSAWLSLDEGDSDLGVFLSYFIAAVRTVFPSGCAETLALLQASTLPPAQPLTIALSNDLERLAEERDASGASVLPAGQRFVLVLDDYHLVREPAVHALLGELLQHPSQTLHLVISARQDPPFPLHTLRGRGELSEIRAQELRFTPSEIAAFMQQFVETPLDADALAMVVSLTEGWGTALRLAALSLKTGGEVPGPELGADNRYVFEYLAAEVLARIPAATQEFLITTSILDRLSGPLCDAVAPPADPVWTGEAYLKWLAAENVFTFSLDEQGVWYRYHHLFQKLLRKELERSRSPQEIAALHSRASAWFAENGQIEEAIRYALMAGDEMEAVQLVERHRHQEMDLEHWRQLERWLSLMPRRLIDTRPELLLLEAWLVQKQWRYSDLPDLLERIEALLRQARPAEPELARMGSEIDVLRSLVYYYMLDGERSFELAKRALEHAPLECSTVRGFAWLYYAGGLYLLGDVPAAVAALSGALKEDAGLRDTFSARIHFSLAITHWMSADIRGLLLTARQLLTMGTQRDLAEAAAWGHYFQGCARYHLNDMAEAEREFAAVVNQRYTAHSFAFSQSAFGLASVFLARGDDERVREVIDSVRQYALDMDHERILKDAVAFEALVALRQGAPAKARQWAVSHSAAMRPVPMTTFHVALVTRVRILVATESVETRSHTDNALTHLLQVTTGGHNTRYMIEALALKALLQQARGELDGALADLQRALDLSAPGGALRIFIDLGPDMARLLHLLVVRSGVTDYSGRLLAAFGEGGTAESEQTRRLPAPVTAQPVDLIEPLTGRELEVLALLGERLIDKEIARELNISPLTVKRHACNIYQKLAVGTRREAVDKAVELGLLSASLSIRTRRPPPP